MSLSPIFTAFSDVTIDLERTKELSKGLVERTAIERRAKDYAKKKEIPTVN